VRGRRLATAPRGQAFPELWLWLFDLPLTVGALGQFQLGNAQQIANRVISHAGRLSQTLLMEMPFLPHAPHAGWPVDTGFPAAFLGMPRMEPTRQNYERDLDPVSQARLAAREQGLQRDPLSEECAAPVFTAAGS